MSAVCRVCLSSDFRMYSIENIALQDIFEKLTNLKMSPGMMCVACGWQLRRCGRFAAMAAHSQSILADVARRGLEVTQETLTKLKMSPAQTLSISLPSSMQTISLLHSEEPIKEEVTIKQELVDTDTKPLTVEDLENVFTEPVKLRKSTKKKQIKSKDLSDFEDIDYTETKVRRKLKTDRNNDIKDCLKQDTEKKRRKVRVTVEDRTCEFCNKVCKRRNELIVHRRTHTGEKPYKCNECTKSFATSSTLIGHKKTHIPLEERAKPYACNQCEKAFCLKETLHQHIQTHGERKYACDECGKAFVLLVKLRNHKRRHGGARAHTCDRCARAYKTSEDLRHHMIVHSGSRPHSCPHCSKNFQRGYELRLHLRVHTGDKPYACHLCGKAFSQSGSLRSHLTTHSDERPFPCEICGFRFKDKYSLAKHLSSHAGGPPCACAVCGRQCASVRGAAAHARTHARPPAVCPRCRKAFTDVSRMRRHQRNVRCVPLKE